MPIELWMVVSELTKKLKLPDKTMQDKALFSFCNDPRIFKSQKAERYILHQENRPLWPSLKSLTFPHSKLDHDLLACERNANEHLSVTKLKRVEKLKMLFWEIKLKQDNVDEWFDALTEAENPDFLKINVEHRLSFQLWDKKLWKLYIQYLEKQDSSEMLRVYSKYCRFFMDDNDMLEEYKVKSKKYGHSRVPWKNRFTNEKPAISSVIPLYDIKEEDDDEDVEDEYYFDNVDMKYRSQIWSMPPPIIRYMMLTASSTILRKFHRSCKYFYAKKPKLFCYQFFCADFVSQSIKYKKESLDCMIRLFLPFHVKNLHVTNSFLTWHSNSFMLTRMIKNNVIVECTAKQVELICQIITRKELTFLIGHGNVEFLHLTVTVVLNATIDDKENNMLLEDILQMVPKIKSFHNDQVFTSPNTFKLLAEMQFINKFLHFDVEVIQDDFHMANFCEFIKKNAALYSTLKFKLDNTDEKVKELEKAANDCFDSTLKKKSIPKVFNSTGIK